MSKIWNKKNTPILILAPMYDVTDVVFREIISYTAPPDIFFTEFVNMEGLLSKSPDHALIKLKYSEKQRPIIAQIWGREPDAYFEGAKKLIELGFDGIDINMGCPQRKILKFGVCGNLINNRDLAKKIIEATIKGANGLPVSVKTRIGFGEIDTENWVDFLLKFNLKAITLHGRTIEQKSKGFADWNEIKKAVKLRNEKKSKTLIIGNGDVDDYAQALNYTEQYDVDGVMIGRGIFKNLWAFSKNSWNEDHTEELLPLMEKHLKMHKETYNGYHYGVMKKFYKIYVKDKKIRNQFMETTTHDEALALLNEIA